MALWKPEAQLAKDFAFSPSCQGKMTQNPSTDVVRPSIYTKKNGHIAPVLWDVGGDGSEGLNIQNTSTSIQFISFPFISPSSMLKLKGFQQGLSGYVDGLSINEHSMQPQLLATLTFSPWKGLSNSVLSFAHGIASEDLDPNAWRHHESETNVQTEDDLQATHWMHSMTAHTQGILWKMIEPRSRGWLCCSRKQMLSNFRMTKKLVIHGHI